MRFPIIILSLTLALTAPVLAATEVIYPGGAKDVTVPVDQYISVFAEGGSKARVSKQVGYPNMPTSFVLETNGDVEDEETHFGPYTTETVVRIEAGTDRVLYSVGADGVKVPCSVPVPELDAPSGSLLRIGKLISQPQSAPTAKTTDVTLTAAELLGRLLTGTHTAGSTQTYTLPTGTLMDAATTMAVGDSFEWGLINLSAAAADTITLAAGTGHTIVGAVLVPSNHSTTGGANGTNSSRWLTRKTAANTFITYRIN